VRGRPRAHRFEGLKLEQYIVRTSALARGPSLEEQLEMTIGYLYYCGQLVVFKDFKWKLQYDVKKQAFNDTAC
jgi:hypothetical protein